MDTTTPQSLGFQSTAFDLLSYYSLESEYYPHGLAKGMLLGRWLQTYPEQWVRWALVESLYQGRYKAYCVEQILALWSRRGGPIYHFNSEFESMVCKDIPQRDEKTVGGSRPMEEMSEVEQSSLLGQAAREPVGGSTPLAEPRSEDLGSSVVLETDPVLESSPREEDVEDYWARVFEPSSLDTRESILRSVLNNDQLLPLTFSRTGLVPIHRFQPEAEPVEFCEKLAAIASHQESARFRP